MSRIAWVDVFATGPMTGNPLAVILEADDWPARRMQAMAAELGLSETAFVLPPEGDGDLRLRIFTPRRELPMAGHPVVGAAWVINAAGLIDGRGRIETGAGVLEVRARGAVATMEQARPEAGAAVDAAEAAAALGLAAAGDAGPARIWSTGLPQLMLPLADTAALGAALPDERALRALGERDGWLGLSAFVVTADEPGRIEAAVRHFAPALGIAEDPVTGSAAGALGACLAERRRGPLELIVRQGESLGRPGEVAVRVGWQGGSPGPVQVGGRVVPLFEGVVGAADGDRMPGPGTREGEDQRR